MTSPNKTNTNNTNNTDNTGPAAPARTAVVTGASRGLGRAVAAGLVRDGLRVHGVARDPEALEKVRVDLGDAFVPEVGDVRDDDLAGRLLDAHHPDVVVLAAGATPLMRPIQEQTWESFGAGWEVDVRQVLSWTRRILLHPPAGRCSVVAFSSGAALRGSPLSGGYAGAKSMIRFITAYAAEEADRAGLPVRFTCVLPALTPGTDLGAQAVAAYAARAGIPVSEFVAAMPGVPTAESLADAVLTIAVDDSYDQPAYVLPPAGGIVTP